jgi:glyoxylase-like metal-dependent hydrolase (beta-lactamase superfamily II)
MLSWQVGRVKVTRVVEMELPVKAGAEFFMPQATPPELRKTPWLYPDFVSEDEIMQMSVHALLVEAPGLRLVVDTCIGNDKPRALLRGGALSTNFLKDLEAIGWTRDSVDAVVCTHLHVDHVGWNTMLVDGKWVPTFPNARYHIGRIEYEHWVADAAGDQQEILDD